MSLRFVETTTQILHCRYGIVSTFRGIHLPSRLGGNKSHTSTARTVFLPSQTIQCGAPSYKLVYKAQEYT